MVNSQALKAGFYAKLFSLGRLGTCYYSLTVFGTIGQYGEGARGRGARPPRVPSAREREGGVRSRSPPTYTQRSYTCPNGPKQEKSPRLV